MRRRKIRSQVWLDQIEKAKLKTAAKKSGLSQEAYLRSLINGYSPKELPPIDYHVMMRELHAVGNNLNQLAAKANATGHLDVLVFKQEAERLRESVQRIQQAVTAPEKRTSLKSTPSP